MKHESDVLTKVTELRTAWAGANSVGEKATLDNKLTESLKSIMAVAVGRFHRSGFSSPRRWRVGRPSRRGWPAVSFPLWYMR